MLKQDNQQNNKITHHIAMMSNDYQKTKDFINEGYDKILLDYLSIESFINNLSSSSDFLDSIKKIKNDLSIMKDNFSSFILAINEMISSLTSHDSSTNNSDISKSMTLTPRMRSSYDMISNEFDKIEKVTKDIIITNEVKRHKKQKRIILLEKKLQQYCEDVKKVDFNSLEKEYNTFTSNYNDKQIISNYITKNSKVEKYSLLGYEDSQSVQSEDFFDDQSKNFNTTLHNEEIETEEGNIDNNTIVNEIIKNNPSKGEEMIQLIESILSKSNSNKKKQK